MTHFNQVGAIANSTVANFGPGFDVFGLCLNIGHDKVIIKQVKEKDIYIEIEGYGSEKISTIPNKNTSGLVAKHILNDFNINTGLSIKIIKGIRPGSGLGSSAASAAATSIALNSLFGLGLSKFDIIKYAMYGEIAAAGAEHADNVAPSILGGFTIIRSYDPFDIIKIDPPPNMVLCISLPNIQISTKVARNILPKEISIKKMVQNIGNSTSIISALYTGNLNLLGKAMEDHVVVPARSKLIPNYYEVVNMAKQEGALGVTISGAGPAIVALIDERKTNPKKVINAMKQGFKNVDLDTDDYVCKPGRGAVITGLT